MEVDRINIADSDVDVVGDSVSEDDGDVDSSDESVIELSGVAPLEAAAVHHDPLVGSSALTPITIDYSPLRPRLPNPASSSTAVASGSEQTSNRVTEQPSVLDTSSGDFQEKKVARVPSPKPALVEGSDSDEQDCPICFEPWTNSGAHRLSSLKCGHLFGLSCIQKWLKGHGGKCPQCNVKAKRKDIRILYAKTLKVQDTSEKDKALQDLAKEKEARQTAEMQAAEARMFLQMARDECRRLTEDLERQKQQLEISRKAAAASGGSHGEQQQGGVLLPDSPTKTRDRKIAMFSFDKAVKIFDGGGCRVMSYCPSQGTLCVSQPSASPLFPGFGIKKLNTMDFRGSQYVALHSKMIRDLAVSPYSSSGLLLSASMDKTIKLTSLVSNAVVQTFTCPQPVWSCVWDSQDDNVVYAGLQNGRVYVYDSRNTQEHVMVLNDAGATSPVVSLQYVKQKADANFSSGGLLVAQLNRSQFLEKKTPNDYRLHVLPLEGSVTSLSVHDQSRHLLATYRPSQGRPFVRHTLYELSSTCMTSNPHAMERVCTCNSLQTFHGGSTMKVLSRSKLFGHFGSGGLVVAGDEASQSVQIWDVQSGLLHQKIPVQSPIIDVACVQHQAKPAIVALTDKQIIVLKCG